MIKTRIETLVMKRTTEADAGKILHFIHQLAIYEKLTHEVEATEENIKDAIFVQHAAEVFILEYKGIEIGFVLITINFSTFVGKPGIYLEDLYIDEEYRGQGFGKEVFYQLAKIAVERGYGRIDWACLDWNEPSIQFYLKLGAKPLSDWTTYRLDKTALEAILDKKEV